ncbi:MAG: hypothetical protein KatS3mg119_0474 [Rhodothalassiaceae bacterium]|nr:MAG: hypothetical protein KatS3mg119_0474 [Rhodothalassiaceae bacterium]
MNTSAGTGGRERRRLVRLKRRPAFVRVQRAGRRAVRPSLVLQAAPRAEVPAEAIGVGFTVTRRTGGAVVRNRIRRRLKAAAAAVLPEAGRPGTDYVIIGRRAALHRPFDRILRDLRSALAAVHQDPPRGGAADAGQRR